MKTFWKWIVVISHWIGNAAPFLVAYILAETAYRMNPRAEWNGFMAGLLLVFGIKTLVDENKKRRRYYELIGVNGVIGVCSPTNDEELAHVVKEDYIKVLGKITRKQFDSFGDNPWTRPISHKRYSVRVKNVVVLDRTEYRCPSGDHGMDETEG